jgi:hypothetical protein
MILIEITNERITPTKEIHLYFNKHWFGCVPFDEEVLDLLERVFHKLGHKYKIKELL